MSKPNKFMQSGEQTATASTVTVPVAPTPQEVPARPEANTSKPKPSREHIGAYFAPDVRRQLRQIAAAENTTNQKLIGEALDMLFHSRQFPEIANAGE